MSQKQQTRAVLLTVSTHSIQPLLMMSADELMWKMWDEDVVGITNQNKPLTAEEVLGAWKVAESRCYAKGRYEVAIPWNDDQPPLHCNMTTA